MGFRLFSVIADKAFAPALEVIESLRMEEAEAVNRLQASYEQEEDGLCFYDDMDFYDYYPDTMFEIEAAWNKFFYARTWKLEEEKEIMINIAWNEHNYEEARLSREEEQAEHDWYYYHDFTQQVKTQAELDEEVKWQKEQENSGYYKGDPLHQKERDFLLRDGRGERLLAYQRRNQKKRPHRQKYSRQRETRQRKCVIPVEMNTLPRKMKPLALTANPLPKVAIIEEQYFMETHQDFIDEMTMFEAAKEQLEAKTVDFDIVDDDVFLHFSKNAIISSASIGF